MSDKVQNILIVRQPEEHFTVVLDSGFHFCSSLQPDEALGVVAAALFGGGNPRYVRTPEACLELAKHRTRCREEADTAAPSEPAQAEPPVDAERCRIGEWLPAGHLTNCGETGVAICRRDRGSVVECRLLGGSPLYDEVFNYTAKGWDAARERWIADGRPTP